MELHVSEKGAVSVYYLNYRPFTLYADEWAAAFGAAQVIRRFIAEHHAQVSCRCPDETRRALRVRLERGDLGDQTRLGSLWCKKANTGAVSLYGLRRFPVTLYCAQWLRVLESRDEIEAFIEDNRDALATKGCCVPRLTRVSTSRPQNEVLCADNIIRPLAARPYGQ